MPSVVVCPGCERNLYVGAVEQAMFRGLPVECAHCGADLGDMGPSDPEQTAPWHADEVLR